MHLAGLPWVQLMGREDSPIEGNGNSLQYSRLENSMDRRAWWATVFWVEKSQTDTLTGLHSEKKKVFSFFT